MLLADALENNWLVPEGKIVRALDALCATGVRPRRWRKEVPGQERLRITANDLDSDALAWGKKSHEVNPVAIIYNGFLSRVDSMLDLKKLFRMESSGLTEMRRN